MITIFLFRKMSGKDNDFQPSSLSNSCFFVFLYVRGSSFSASTDNYCIFAASTNDKNMKWKLVFATNNAHKLDEIRSILGERVEILSLKDIGCDADIPETADTLEGNAALKAEYIYRHYGLDCFADDTGLEVEALGGAPGVYSARYAGGEGHDSEANMRKLLHELEGVTQRQAQFRTAICLIEGAQNLKYVMSGWSLDR